MKQHGSSNPPVLLAAGLAVLASVAGWESARTAASTSDSCVPYSVGLDTSLANDLDVAFFGRSWSQVFVAEDTLISSITAWRASSRYPSPLRLYLMEVRQIYDTLTGPDPTRILLVGPQVSTTEFSVNPSPARFVLDPPFALPRRGTFAFAVKDDDYFCSGIVPLLFDSLDTYPYGCAWKLYPTDYCGIGLGVTPFENRDMIFEIEFCRQQVAVRRSTWGWLKAIYR